MDTLTLTEKITNGTDNKYYCTKASDFEGMVFSYSIYKTKLEELRKLIAKAEAGAIKFKALKENGINPILNGLEINLELNDIDVRKLIGEVARIGSYTDFYGSKVQDNKMSTSIKNGFERWLFVRLKNGGDWSEGINNYDIDVAQKVARNKERKFVSDVTDMLTKPNKNKALKNKLAHIDTIIDIVVREQIKSEIEAYLAPKTTGAENVAQETSVASGVEVA